MKRSPVEELVEGLEVDATLLVDGNRVIDGKSGREFVLWERSNGAYFWYESTGTPLDILTSAISPVANGRLMVGDVYVSPTGSNWQVESKNGVKTWVVQGRLKAEMKPLSDVDSLVREQRITINEQGEQLSLAKEYINELEDRIKELERLVLKDARVTVKPRKRAVVR